MRRDETFHQVTSFFPPFSHRAIRALHASQSQMTTPCSRQGHSNKNARSARLHARGIGRRVRSLAKQRRPRQRRIPRSQPQCEADEHRSAWRSRRLRGNVFSMTSRTAPAKPSSLTLCNAPDDSSSSASSVAPQSKTSSLEISSSTSIRTNLPPVSSPR